VYSITDTVPPFPSLPPNSQPQLEIKRFLESAYGLHVEKVDTINYEGKKKRVTGKGATFPGKSRTTGIFVRRPSFKKAYVTLKDPPTTNSTSD